MKWVSFDSAIRVQSDVANNQNLFVINNLEADEHARFADMGFEWRENYGWHAPITWARVDFLKSLPGASVVEMPAEQIVYGVATPAPDQDSEAGRNNPNHFFITDEITRTGGFSPMVRSIENVAAIRLVKALQEEGRQATTEEQATLAKYNGWGGLPSVFQDPDFIEEAWAKQARAVLENHLLSENEFGAARASVSNAHFTAPETVKAIWNVLQQAGFEGGKILEPSMGSGNFFGLMPEAIVRNSELYGIEKDTITGEIARAIYPDANIMVKGYEETKLPTNFFDLTISNVPFGDYSVFDSEYANQKLSIHDYFITKSIDRLKPGGIGAFITSSYTMDKASTKVRRAINKKAVFAGAVRLPSHAHKAQAGTEVTTDILFFVKRNQPLRLDEGEAEWLTSTPTMLISNGLSLMRPVNDYFRNNRERIMGTLQLERGINGSLRVDAVDFGPIGELLAQTKAFHGIADDLARNVIANTRQAVEHEPVDSLEIESDDEYPVGSLIEHQGTVYITTSERGEDGKLKIESMGLTGRPESRALGLIKIRDQIDLVFKAQLESPDDERLNEAARRNLNEAYDAFVSKNGPINKPANRRIIRDDPKAGRVLALEHYDETEGTAKKADIFYQQVIGVTKTVQTAASESDALAASLAAYGRPDIAYMTELYNSHFSNRRNPVTEEELTHRLQSIGQLFRNPETDELEIASVYLSGNVRQKLKEAEAAALLDEDEYSLNVEHLTPLIPQDLPPSDIQIRLGAPWVPSDVVRKFALETFAITWEQGFSIRYREVDGAWLVKGDPYDIPHTQLYKYGTDKRNPLDLLNRILNQQSVAVYTTIKDPDGKTTQIPNEPETFAAKEKADLIKDAFVQFVWNDQEISNQLVRLYNDRFNSIVPRKYDGSHLTFPGLNANFIPRDQQKNAIWRTVLDRKSLLAHEVGVGKTFEMLGSAMELKRLGFAKKPLIAVKNHMLEQIERELLQLYPMAKALVIDKESLAAKKRMVFLGQATNNDWDIIIITHSMLERLDLPQDYKERFYKSQLMELRTELEGVDLTDKDARRSHSVKAIEQRIKKLEHSLKLLMTAKPKDLVRMDEIGVDFLFVDESHNFKNLAAQLPSNSEVSSGNIAGSNRAFDLFMKSGWIYETRGDYTGLVLASGTPASNSVLEFYNIQRYLQPEILEEIGLNHLSAWAGTFLEPKTQWEPDPSGSGFRMRTRHALANLADLIKILGQHMDVVFADDVPTLKRPEVETINVIADMSATQESIMEELAERTRTIREGNVDPSEDNLLKIVSDGRKLSLDSRLYDPELPQDEDSKLLQLIDNLHKEWELGAEKRSSQLVFCDMGTPGKNKPFVVYHWIRDQCIEAGIPADEIAIVHDAASDQARAELFKSVREGEVRILLGSTAKMGEGTNVQAKLAAWHHVDPPWRPSDVVQRDGRGHRHGNENSHVRRYIYTTKGSFDAFLWSTMKIKYETFVQALKGDPTVRSLDMDGDPTYAETLAITTSDPLIQQKLEVDQKVARYASLEKVWRDQNWKSQLRQSEIKKGIGQLKDRIEQLESLPTPVPYEGEEKVSFDWLAKTQVDGEDKVLVRGDRKKLLQSIKRIVEKNGTKATGGLKIYLAGVPVKMGFVNDSGRQKSTWAFEGSDMAFRRVPELEEALRNRDESLSFARSNLLRDEVKLSEEQSATGGGFEFSKELEEARAEQHEIDRLIAEKESENDERRGIQIQ